MKGLLLSLFFLTLFARADGFSPNDPCLMSKARLAPINIEIALLDCQERFMQSCDSVYKEHPEATLGGLLHCYDSVGNACLRDIPRYVADLREQLAACQQQVP